MARLVVAWVTGAQNNTPGSAKGPLLSGLCCKHFAAYDLEEMPTSRVYFNANLTSRCRPFVLIQIISDRFEFSVWSTQIDVGNVYAGL